MTATLGRPVVDRTGLAGAFDFALDWAPAPGDALTFPETTPEQRDDRPSIFTALQEQLGLKLESTQALIDVLTIESVARPSPN